MYVVTAVSVIFLNLLHGVLIGLALTGWRVVVEGAACTFLALPRLTRMLTSVPQGATVTVAISVHYLDYAAHQAITDWQRQHEATGGTVHIHGVDETGQRRTHEPLLEAQRPGAAA